jgi:hypothetical protein
LGLSFYEDALPVDGQRDSMGCSSSAPLPLGCRVLAVDDHIVRCFGDSVKDEERASWLLIS